MDGEPTDGSRGSYGGIVGAFPYAIRTSGSLLFRSYVVVGGLLAALVALVFLLALPVWIAETVRAPATLTLSRAFLVLVWLLVFVPLVAPVLLVARRHRRADGSAGGRYDAALGLSGYLFVLAAYVGLLIAAPPGSRGDPPGAVAPVVDWLYSLPRAAGVVPPLLALAVLALSHRALR